MIEINSKVLSMLQSYSFIANPATPKELEIAKEMEHLILPSIIVGTNIRPLETQSHKSLELGEQSIEDSLYANKNGTIRITLMSEQVGKTGLLKIRRAPITGNLSNFQIKIKSGSDQLSIFSAERFEDTLIVDDIELNLADTEVKLLQTRTGKHQLKLFRGAELRSLEDYIRNTYHISPENNLPLLKNLLATNGLRATPFTSSKTEEFTTTKTILTISPLLTKDVPSSVVYSRVSNGTPYAPSHSDDDCLVIETSLRHRELLKTKFFSK